ncbi:MAG: Ig-like domain-containing protein [Actinomycetota bacterium]
MGTIAAVVISAFLADGRPGSASRTNDGGAWLINRQEGFIGHVDRVSRELSRRIGPFQGLFDVEQAPGIVVVNDPIQNRVTLLDPARTAERASVSVQRPLQVAAAPGAVVLADAAAGDVWRLPSEEFATLEDLESTPRSVDTEGPVAVSVSLSGLVSVVDPAGAAIMIVDDTGAVSSLVDESLSGIAVDHHTVVGNRTIVVSGPDLFVVDGERVRQLEHGLDIAALQQPGGGAGVVIAVTGDGDVVEIDLEDGSIFRRLTLRGTEPLRPIVHRGCLHVVTLSPAPTYHYCDRVEPLSGAGRSLRLRLINDWVWVNDVERGGTWSVTLNNQELLHISDWSSTFPEEEELEPVEGSSSGDRRDRFTPDGELPDELNNLDDDGLNTSPEALPDEAATRAGRAAIIDVLANDRDDDNDPLVVESVDGDRRVVIVGGVATVTADGRAVQFVPDPGYVGSTSFEYTIHDGRGGRSSASATVEVTEQTDVGNRPPVPETDNATVRAGRAVSINLLDNDTDPDGDVLVLVGVEDDGTGAISFTPDGNLTYTPDIAAPDGVLTLDYLIRDDYGAESRGTARIRVRPTDSNQRPVSRNDVGSTVVGDTLSLDVLANDADPDGDALTSFNLTAVDPPNVAATLTPGGSFLFTPEEPGTYRFVYSASDGPESTPAQIRIEVEPEEENRPPVPVVDELALVIGDTRIVRVLDNDSDPDGDVIGLVDWFGVDGLDISEVPGVGFSVRALPEAPPRLSFPYFVSDGQGDAVGSSVIVSAVPGDPVDYPPVANADVIEVRPGQPTSIPVLDNDYDPEGGPLQVVGPLADVDEGFLQLGPDGQGLIITVDEEQRFAFSFGYDIEDDGGNRASAVVEVRVVPPDRANRPPIATPDEARTLSDRAVTIPVLNNDSDPDGDPISVEGIASQPANGRVEINEDGTVRYIPRAGYAGTDEFTYTLTDSYLDPAGGEPGRAIGSVSVGVIAPTAVNRDPNAVDDDQLAPVTVGGAAIGIEVLANDSDPDGDRLTVVDVTTPAVGVVGIVGDIIQYTPPAESDARTVSFTYTIADGRGGSDQAVVLVELLPEVVPEPPVAVNDQTGPHQAGTIVSLDPRLNDFDPDGTPGGLQVVPSGDGSFTVEADGTISFVVPETTASFPYRVVDGDGLESAPALVTVLVAENLAPVVPVRTVETAFNTPIEISLHDGISDPEGDDLLYALGTNRQGGSVSAVGTPAANLFTVLFSPDTDFEGQASFDFLVDDQHGHRVASTVLVNVLPPENRPPTATPLTVDVQAGVDTPVDLTALVDDPDLIGGQETLSFSVSNVSGAIGATTGANGQVTVTSAVTDGGAAGGFDYAVTDLAGEAATSSVTVNLITEDSPPPTVVDDTANDFQGNTVVVRALDNDSDNLPPELQDGLFISAVGVVDGGTTSTDGQEVTFVPRSDFFGTATFTYTVQDARRSTAYQSTGSITIDMVGRPEAPQAPTIAPPRSRELTITWTAPIDNGGPITGYVLEYSGDDGSSASTTIGPPATTNHTWTGLTNGVAYTFTVAAINDAGQGEFSPPSLPEIPDEAPEPPSMGALEFGDEQITVNWSAALSAGTPVIDYEIEISGGTSATRTTGSAITTLVWDGLTNGTTYCFRARARNSATNDNDGWSEWSSPPPPCENPLTVPDAPAQPAAVRGDRQVTVTWSPPFDGGDPITGYEIRRVGSGQISPLTPQPTATQTYVWTDLANGQDVSFEVRAINRGGIGPWSAPSPVVTPCFVPDAATNVSAERGDQQVTVRWTPPADQGCAIDEYRIVAQPGNLLQTATAGSSSHVFTGLTNGTTYSFTVTAVNEVVIVDGLTPIASAAAQATPAGEPIGPFSLACSNSAPRTIGCTWAAADPNGTPIIRYEVLIGGSWQDAGSGTSYTYNAPADGAQYNFQVRAVNDVGAGAASSPASVTTWSDPDTPVVSASAAVGQVSATWNTPGNGGTAITAHQAKVVTGGCTTGGGTRTNPGSPETWTGLSTGTTYRVCVRYQNAVGWGAWGSSNTVTVPAPPPSVSISFQSPIGNAEGEPGCSSALCTWVDVSVANMSANSSLSVQCQENQGGGWSTFWNSTLTTNGAGAGGRRVCYWGFPSPAEIRMVVDGVPSNSLSH